MKTSIFQYVIYITKNSSGFEFQATSSDLEEITYPSIFVTESILSLATTDEEEENLTFVAFVALSSPQCCAVVPRSFLVSGMRQRFCGHGHGSPGDVVSTELPVVLSARSLFIQQPLLAPHGTLGEQLYSLGSLQNFRPRYTNDSISKRQRRGAHYSETHYCFFFLFVTLSSLGGMSFFLESVNKFYFVFWLSKIAYTAKSFFLFTSSANYS